MVVLLESVLVLLVTLLAVQSNGLPGYEIVGNQTRIYYVDSEDGVDTNNGLAPNLAFKTIKRACACCTS